MKIYLFLYAFLSFNCTSKNETLVAENESEMGSKKDSIWQIENPKNNAEKLSNAAISIIDPTIEYDPAYTQIKYPNGDVPKNKGVCTDVVIRAYRKLGIDLQKEVHEDIKAHFDLYPSKEKWGHNKPDTNIDHRRVPNLEVFFTRKGKKLEITSKPEDYKTGAIVTWFLADDKIPHIGIVTHLKTKNGTPMVVHNYGNGQVLEDILFNYKINGHFFYEK